MKYGVFIMNKSFMDREYRKLEVEIEFGGYAVLDSNWHRENECSPFSRLYYVRSGSGYLRHGDETVEMSGGHVYIIPAEYEFSYGCTELEKIFFHISVTTAEQYELFSGMGKIYSLPFSEEEYGELYRCYFSDSYTDFLRLKAAVYQTLARLLDKSGFRGAEICRYSEVVERTMKYIQDNARADMTVKEISHALFISESKLRNAFRDEMGVTVGKYADEIIFRRARVLLAARIMTIDEISRELGFCDRFYFSRRFKQQCGKTPAEYRRECSELDRLSHEYVRKMREV